jgi:hypothetical protein
MMGPSRWFGVGQASGDDAEPGAKAAEQAMQHPDAKLIIVFCSIALDLNVVLRQIRERAPKVPLIGCTTAGEIATSGPGDAGVVVTALGGEGFSVATACATESSRDLRAAGAAAARCMSAVENREHRVLMLLTDSLSGDQQEIVRGAYQVLGAGVPLVGGGAGDDSKMAHTYQLHNDQVLTDAVVAAGIGSDSPFGIGVRHGWLRVGDPMLVTRSGGNRVDTLDDEPALDVYLEHLGYGGMWPEDQELLARIAQTHPLGLARRVGEDQIRFISGGDFKERSLTCIAEVPQGGMVWIMEGDAESVLAATDAACRDSLSALGGRAPLGMVAFDCIARRGVLGNTGIMTEIAHVSASAGGAPVAGFYTYGEIARTQGMSGFHNQTLVVLSIS